MNTLPTDLLNLIIPYLKSSALVLLRFNNIDVDKEYLNLSMYKDRYKLAIKRNNLNWIHQYNEIYSDQIIKLYNNYKAGKNGQVGVRVDTLQLLCCYLEGLSVGQHSQLFNQYSQSLIPNYQMVDTWKGSYLHYDALKIEFLMNFKDQDYIIQTLESWDRQDDVYLSCLAKHEKYQALEYFINAYEIKTLSLMTMLYLFANHNWKLAEDYEIKFNSHRNAIFIGCLTGDLELLDFLEENTRGDFYVNLASYLPDMPDDIYKHFKDRIPICSQPQGIVFCKCSGKKAIPYKPSKPNHYNKRIMKELRPFFTNGFMMHLVDNVRYIQHYTWVKQTILELVRYYIINNEPKTVKVIIEIIFKIKNQQSFMIFEALCEFITNRLKSESDVCNNLLRYRSCTFEVFNSIDVMNLL